MIFSLKKLDLPCLFLNYIALSVSCSISISKCVHDRHCCSYYLPRNIKQAAFLTGSCCMHGQPRPMCFTETISNSLIINLQIGFGGKEITALAPNVYTICRDHKVIKFLNQYSNSGLLFCCISFVLKLHKMILITSTKFSSFIQQLFVEWLR